MDPVLRTRRLADSLKDVAFAFGAAFLLFGRIPFASVIVCGYLAMGLADLSRLTDGAGRLALRGAAVLAVSAGLLSTLGVWLDSRWLPAGYLLAIGVGVQLTTVGYSRLAADFGGAARWQRARAAAVAVVCGTSLMAGMIVQQPVPVSQFGTINLSGHDSWVAIPAMGVLLLGVLVVGIATSDLRDRVKVAIVQYDADAAASVPSEHVNG